MPNIIRIVGYCSITRSSKGQGREQLVVRSLQTMDKTRSDELAWKVMCVFLCEKHNSTSELPQAMTMQLDKRLNECALNLNKLKYHYSCLTALSIENQDNSELPQEREVYSLVFSEFVTYIMETKTSSDNSVVFALQIWSVSTNSDLNN